MWVCLNEFDGCHNNRRRDIGPGHGILSEAARVRCGGSGASDPRRRQRGVRTPKDIVLFLLMNILTGSVMKVKNVIAIVELGAPSGDAQRVSWYNGG